MSLRKTRMSIEHKALVMVQFVFGFQGDVMTPLRLSDAKHGTKRKETKQ